jgi:sec-independent protein translocase protein TatB
MEASFFGIGFAELVFIMIIALIVLGPERLPGVIREVVKVVRHVRALFNELSSEFGEEIKTLDELNPKRILKELTDELDEEAKQPKPTAGKSNGVKPVSSNGAAPAARGKPTAAKPPALTSGANSGKKLTGVAASSAQEVGARPQPVAEIGDGVEAEVGG